MMKERPMLFSDPMVRALLAGTKTQTRRVVKFAREPIEHPQMAGVMTARIGRRDVWVNSQASHPNHISKACPYGQPGDRLWVRETFSKVDGQTHPWIATDYRATYTHGDRLGDHLGIKRRWTPSIHMSREASRILLEITSVRVERLQEISEADAQAEGVCGVDWGHGMDYGGKACYRKPYQQLWESINGPGSWDANPWVWVIEFKREQP